MKIRLRFEPSRGCRCRGRRRSRRCTGRSAPIRAETWEALNRTLLASARQEKVETGKVVWLDSTVTAALMHEPSDSSLLWDGVRVLVRLLKAADALVGDCEWRNHRRAAKKRAHAIRYARNRLKRVKHYRELIKLTRATLAYADQATTRVWRAANPMAATLWQAEFRHYRPLIERIIAQTERRVLHGEAVAANEKTSACSSRTPTSPSRAVVTFNTVTSST
jgi:IS5 family transposase